MLQTSRGIGFPGGISGVRAWGIEGVGVLASLGGRWCLRFDGLLGGFCFAAGTSVSDDVSGGVGSDCGIVFFCLRSSRLLRPARRLIASLLRYSVVGIISGSAGAGLVGLATCARVGAIDIAVVAGLLGTRI